MSPERSGSAGGAAPTFVERLARALVAAPVEVLTPGTPLEDLDEAWLVRITDRVVEEIAARGRVVLVGRAAVAVLARRPRGAARAGWSRRLSSGSRIVMEREQVTAERAREMIHETDEHRARYHEEYYQRDWSDPAGYHMVLNTGALGFDGAADLIVARARAVGW